MLFQGGKIMRRNAVLLNIIARTMNAGGSALVTAFDAGSAAFNCTMSALSPGERTKLGTRIKAFEKKIQALSSGIAKETSKYADPAAALESETVVAILNTIRELNAEIALMKQRIAEIDGVKAAKKPQQDSDGISGFIAHSISGLLPGEKAGLQNKIFANEKKIQNLYVEFAKEVSKQPDPYEAIHSQAVTAINAKINELNAENSTLKLQFADLAKPKADKQKPAEKKPQSAVKKPQPEIKKPQPESAGVAKFFMHAIAGSLSGYLPGEKLNIERKLAENDKKVKSLYLEVAKETAKYPDPNDAIAAAPVVALVAKITELKAEIATLNQRKAELSGVKAAATPVKAATAPVKAEPVSEEVPVETPVAVEAVVASDAAALSETESGLDAVVETVTLADSEPSEVTETEGSAVVDAVVETAAHVESDPSEDTPYVNSRTKLSTIPVPALQPPTEEDIKAVVRDIQAEEARNELASEETVTALDEQSEPVEPAVEEELNEQSEAVVPAVEDELSEQSEAVESAVEEEQTEQSEPVEPVVGDELAVATAAPAETDAIESESDSTPISFDEVLEHPPIVPVPEAEEVFGLQGADTDAVTITAADAVEVTVEETTAEVDAVETAASEEVAQAVPEETETVSELVAETTSEETTSEEAVVSKDAAVSEEVAVSEEAETSVEEEPVSLAPAADETPAVVTVAQGESFGVVSDHVPFIPVARPEATLKEESGSVFRTRLYRNQFSILTPVPDDMPAAHLEPPTREDIESVTRGMQADDVEKYKISEILEDHAGVIALQPDAEESSEPQETETDSVPSAATDDVPETEDEENPSETDVDETDAGDEDTTDAEEEDEEEEEVESATADDTETTESTPNKKQGNRKKDILSRENVNGAASLKDRSKKRR